MKRRTTILLLAVVSLITAVFPTTAHAADTKGVSASFAGPQSVALTPHIAEKDHRAEILQSFIEQYNSPLAEHADTLVKQADANNIDWRMVAAISGVESQFGIQIPGYSFNGWGFGVYGNNVRYFTSWDDGISTVSTALRQEYMNQRGATNIYSIGATYAADPAWASKVQNYMDQIDAYGDQYIKRTTNPTLSISL
ncbi:MAG: hypothetical protein ACREHC_00035 [Candidatus Levyibacteriota bacterium]